MPDTLTCIDVFNTGNLSTGEHQYPCVLGTGGIKTEKTEGDGVTPAGTFTLRRVFYRFDRLPPPQTRLIVRELTPTDGWCDDPNHKKYNQLVSLPFAGSHEDLWREDGIYDIIVELGYNDDPPIPPLGSAIFMHIARDNGEPTQGCVALAREDLLSILEKCDGDTMLRINP